MDEQFAAPWAVIALGSNIEPETNIRAALDLLAAQVRITRLSVIYRSRPLDRPSQGDFLNGACLTDGPPPLRAFKLGVLREIEQRLGRVRTSDKYAPRTIDLDIVLAGDVVMDEPDLRIPDPDLSERPFIAVPAWEVVPNAVIPGIGRSLANVVHGMDTEGIVPMIAYTNLLRARLAP